MDATIVLQDGMRFVAKADSGHEVIIDSSVSGGGTDMGSRPMELLAMGLGGCTAMDVISIATKKRQRIDAYRLEVTGDQRDDYPQVYTEITMVHVVEGRDLSEAAIRRAIELSATKYCPVNAMLSAGATVVHHGYRIRSTGECQYEAAGEVVSTGPYQRPDVIT